jgi:hypothetical protein
VSDDDTEVVDPPAAAPIASEVARDLPKWCKGVVYDSRRNVVGIRLILPVPPPPGSISRQVQHLPVELIMEPDRARGLVKSLERCIEASSKIIVEVG